MVEKIHRSDLRRWYNAIIDKSWTAFVRPGASTQHHQRKQQWKGKEK